jgi:hypothetical protein
MQRDVGKFKKWQCHDVSLATENWMFGPAGHLIRQEAPGLQEPLAKSICSVVDYVHGVRDSARPR